jgi:hypothetical protein
MADTPDGKWWSYGFDPENDDPAHVIAEFKKELASRGYEHPGWIEPAKSGREVGHGDN